MLVPLLLIGGGLGAYHFFVKSKKSGHVEQDFETYTHNNPVRTPTGGTSKYKVAVGDNFMQVAVRFNTPEGGLISLNKINPGLSARPLKPGEIIGVPKGTDRGPKKGAAGTVS